MVLDTHCSQAKQKKMKDKYGDQDEEERKLRMKILAVSQTTKFFCSPVFDHQLISLPL